MSKFYSHKPRPGFKLAVCSKCGKDLKSYVPEDAEQITCFKCYNVRD